MPFMTFMGVCVCVCVCVRARARVRVYKPNEINYITMPEMRYIIPIAVTWSSTHYEVQFASCCCPTCRSRSKWGVGKSTVLKISTLWVRVHTIAVLLEVAPRLYCVSCDKF